MNVTCEWCGSKYPRRQGGRGRFCGRECAYKWLAKSQAEQAMDMPPPQRLADHDDCAHYLECLGTAARADAPWVCQEGCTRYARQDTHATAELRSPMGAFILPGDNDE